MSESIAANIILTALAPDKFYKQENAIRALLPLFDQPKQILTYALSCGWLQDYKKDGFAYDSKCWLPFTQQLETKQGERFTVEIGEYGYPATWETKELDFPKFSYFKAPIKRKPPILPYRSITLPQLFKAITGTAYQVKTKQSINLYQQYLITGDKKQYSDFKRNQLDFFTPSGEFAYKEDAGLTKLSNYVCFDFDHIQDVEGLKAALLTDKFFETQLLFTSPGGKGLKWVVSLEGHNLKGHPTAGWFKGVAAYTKKTYGSTIDSLPDPSRACFVGYDPQAYIHPKYL